MHLFKFLGDRNDSTKSTPGTSCESSPKFKRNSCGSNHEDIQLTHLSKVNHDVDVPENSQIEDTAMTGERIGHDKICHTSEDECADVTSSQGRVKTI